jgi:hypothetical protein
MKNNKKIKAITFSGLSIALIVVLMFMASIFDILDYSIAAICGIVITFVLIEFGTSSAIGVYVGASILGLILIPNKINALLFVTFCGWYPLVKRYLEKVSRPIELVLKFAIFNATLTAIIVGAKYLFLFKMDIKWCIAMYLISNFTFLMYDILITKLIFLYVHKYRKRFTFLK